MLKQFNKWNTSQKIVFSFAVVILIGFVLLALPISQQESSQARLFDHLFHAVSLVSVTGLVIYPISQTYTLFGQVITLILMQIGGLGLMTIVASIATVLGKRITLRDRLAIQEGINHEDATHLPTFLRSILQYAFWIEAVGFLLLSFFFVPELGWGEGLFTALYLVVSSFTNAGFINFGSNSLMAYASNPLIILVLAVLIILGGIGYFVWFDVSATFEKWRHRRGKKHLRFLIRSFSLHTKLAIFVSGILLIMGTLLFLIVEFSNPDTIGNFTFGEKVLTSFFQSVTMRTAGLRTIDVMEVYPFTIFWSLIFMFIGGSPGSTAGGLKTTTFAIVVLFIYNELRGQQNVNIWYYTIPNFLVRNSIVIFTAFLTIFLTGTGILALLNPSINFMVIMLESLSAITTVGLSADLTPSLGILSHMLLMVLMFTGRLGPITLAESLARKARETKDITYSTGKINIG